MNTEAERWYWIGFDAGSRGWPIDDATLYRCPFALEYAHGYREGVAQKELDSIAKGRGGAHE